MKIINNIDCEILIEKLKNCETLASYLAAQMPGLTIQELQNRLENLRDLIQDSRDFFQEKTTEQQ